MAFSTAKFRKGFTLIELLVVIGILAVLLAVTLVAINPARQFAAANDTKRSSDVNAILNAINQYSVDEKGGLPGDNPDPTQNEITINTQNISTSGANICAILVTRYIAALPTDPTSATGGAPITNCALAYDTRYTVVKGGDDRITVEAPNTQIATEIKATR